MQTRNELIQKVFELVPLKNDGKTKGRILSTKRSIVGRAESCDVIINSAGISSIHAVLEIDGNELVVYDMNSTNGTYINGDLLKKIIKEKVKIGDIIQFADVAFRFKEYVKEDLPPVLDSLEPMSGEASVLPPEIKVLPAAAPKVNPPRVVYPLTLDPKSETSEYIFEDAEIIYPIFQYEMGKSAVEVFILYEDVVYAVDYIPQKDGIYYLVGSNPNSADIEYPYLGKDERVPFIEIKGGDIFVNRLAGYEMMYLSDAKSNSQNVIKLSRQDIIRFYRGDLQIYARTTDAPPKVSTPPFFRRDKATLFYVLFAGFLLGLNLLMNIFIAPEEELQKEDVPERLAKILDTPKTFQLKKVEQLGNQEIKKPEETKKVEVKKPEETKPQQEQRQVEKVSEQKSDKKAGDKNAKSEETPKQATVKDDGKRPDKLEAKKAGGKSQKASNTSKSDSASQGHVDTYKSFDFSGNVSNALSKGKGAKSAIANATGAGTGTASGDGSGSVFGGDGNVDNLKRAEVSSSGSLIGSSTGKLQASKGAEGLSDKKGIATVGIPSETVILGSMDPEIIKKLLRDHIPQFRSCYQKELDNASSKEDLSGVVKLNFVIGASGRVNKAAIESELPTSIKECVVNVLKGIPFPEPKGGGNVEVKQPINFYPKRI